MLSTSLGELRTSYPPADKIVHSSKPECVRYLPKQWSDVDTSLLVIWWVSSSSTASPTASRPVVVAVAAVAAVAAVSVVAVVATVADVAAVAAVAAVVYIVRRRIEEVGNGSKNVKLSSG